MEKILLRICLLVLGIFVLHAFAPDPAIYVTRTGHIWFYSKAPLENIEAHNRQASSSLNIASGEMAFQVLIKGFEFEKALMQEHFNENYLESNTYPKATFKGKIINIKGIKLGKAGTYIADVEGDLTMHGVTRKIVVPASFIVGANGIDAKSVFKVSVKDYNIIIPSLVKDKIAETIDINVEMLYKAK